MSQAELNQIFDMVTRFGDALAASTTSLERTVDKFAQQLGSMVNHENILKQAPNNDAMNVLADNHDVNVLEVKVNEAQQEAVESDFFLDGLPPNIDSQDVPLVLAAFGTFIDQQLKSEDLCEPPRFFTNKERTSGAIIGTFKSLAQKSAIERAFESKQPIPVEDVVELPELSTLRGTLVIMRNSLTPEYQLILSEAHRIRED